MHDNEHKPKHDHKEDEEKSMEEVYQVLADKYQLPSLVDLDREFLIGSPEPGNFPLRVVFVKMAERCDFILKILTDVIQPENHLSDMKEAEQLSDIERRKVFEISGRMSFFEKEFLIREFDYDEVKSAVLIKEFYAEWLKYKPEFIGILTSMQQAWTQKIGRRSDYNYFG